MKHQFLSLHREIEALMKGSGFQTSFAIHGHRRWCASLLSLIPSKVFRSLIGYKNIVLFTGVVVIALSVSNIQEAYFTHHWFARAVFDNSVCHPDCFFCCLCMCPLLKIIFRSLILSFSNKGNTSPRGYVCWYSKACFVYQWLPTKLPVIRSLPVAKIAKWVSGTPAGLGQPSALLL